MSSSSDSNGTVDSLCYLKSSCETCNQLWPTCAWCGSSSSCLVATQELSAKALRSSFGSSQTHVFYNSLEYYKTYGRTEYVDSSQSLIGMECLVWITSSRSCSHVKSYCTGQSSCRNCIRRSGCGWCHGGIYGQGGCASGTVTNSFGFKSSVARCPSPRWVFGDWPRYLNEGTFDLLQCQAPRYGNETQIAAASEKPHVDEGMPGHVVPIVIAAFVILSVLLFAVASILLRRSRAPAAQSTGAAGGAVRDARAVNFELLETQVPSCRPVILKGGQLRRYARTEMCQQELPEFPKREGTDTSNATNASCMVPCSVCLADLEKGEEGRYLPCKHLFHRACIDAWLSKSRQCPVCRRDVPRMAEFIAAERAIPGSGATVAGLPSEAPGSARDLASIDLEELPEEDTSDSDPDEEIAHPGITNEAQIYGRAALSQSIQPRQSDQSDPTSDPDVQSESAVSNDVANEGVPAALATTNSTRHTDLGLAPTAGLPVTRSASQLGLAEVETFDVHPTAQSLTTMIQDMGLAVEQAYERSGETWSRHGADYQNQETISQEFSVVTPRSAGRVSLGDHPHRRVSLGEAIA